MARPPRSQLTLAQALARLKEKGLHPPSDASLEGIDDLTLRIREILGILQEKPLKADEMTYLIMYDIENDKVRLQIARYLLREGCIRVQRSVFIARSENSRFQSILDTLKEVNEHYANKDSIILVPVNATDVRSMKLIGRNVQLDTLMDPPNTLFV